MCVLNFSTNPVWNIFHSKNSPRYFQVYSSLHATYRLLSYFNKTWIFSTRSRKVLKCQISWIPNIGRRDDPGGLTRDTWRSSLLFVALFLTHFNKQGEASKHILLSNSHLQLHRWRHIACKVCICLFCERYACSINVFINANLIARSGKVNY